MASYYTVYVRHELFAILQSLPRARRARVAALIDSLGENPFRPADYREYDSLRRPCSVRIIGKHALYFRVDDAAKEVRVLDLVDADTV